MNSRSDRERRVRPPTREQAPRLDAREGGGCLRVGCDSTSPSWVPAWGQAVRNDATQSPATPRDERVESVDERRCPQDEEHRAERPGQANLHEESHAASRIPWNRRSIPRNEPPAVVPRLLGDAREQPSGFFIGQPEQRELLAAVPSSDDTRRPPAEPSGAGVEEDGASELRLALDVRHAVTVRTAVVRGHGVAATTRPLTAVSAATTAMAALAPAASATTPARTAPSANPMSRQKR
jgi:hypothetical protein